MTDNELDLLMRDVLFDVIKLDGKFDEAGEMEFIPSRRHQIQIRSMLNDPLRWMNKKIRPIWQIILRRAAVILLVISINFAALMVVSPTARAAVVQWVMEWYETHIAYRYLGEERLSEMPDYQIGNLPDGYTQIERIDHLFSTMILYEDNLGDLIEFSYTYMNHDTENVFISKDNDIINISVNQMEGQLFVPQNSEYMRTITWIDEQRNMQFLISALFDREELLRMAESVSVKEK